MIGALLGRDALGPDRVECPLVLRQLLDLALEPILEVTEVCREGAEIRLELGAWIRDGGVGNLGRHTQRGRRNDPCIGAADPLFRGTSLGSRDVEHGKLGGRIEIHFFGCRVALNVHRVSGAR